MGVAVGEHIVDLALLAREGLLDGAPPEDFEQPSLNALMARGPGHWRRLRQGLRQVLRAEIPSQALVPMAGAHLFSPIQVADFVDFYASIHHARNVGTMFRGPENALPPNWRYLPIGYHGRSSTVLVSGTDFRRPRGQTRPDPGAPPVFGPSLQLDFELEVGFVVGCGNEGQPLSAAEAEERIFGLVLLNDWSARDIQRWEYVPLGPFLGKSFATSISPWVVPLEALEPFRVEGPVQEPAVLPYLRHSGATAFDVALEAWLLPAGGGPPVRLCATNLRHLYWSMGQMLAHLTSNGTILRPGDLCGTGTISGPEPGSWGSLLELTWNGSRPLELPDGSRRTFLEDGDTVILRGMAERDGRRLSLGEVRGKVLPALPGDTPAGGELRGAALG